jgi:uncharacterized protein (DUF1499 family)
VSNEKLLSDDRRPFRWKRRLIQMFLIGGVLMFALSWTAERPENLGTILGQLRELPDSNNCVSTNTTEESKRMPAIPFEGSAEEAMKRLLVIIGELPRTKVINQTGDYLYVEFSSLIFGYIDDVEFLVDAENNKIDFRSASRVGYSDLGANRKRMKTISERFLQ